MRARVVPVVIVLTLLVGLTPLAYASPPDETWLAGFYDNADYDDVVIALTSASGASDGIPRAAFGPTAEVIRTLRLAEPNAPDSPLRSLYRLRSPPHS